MESLPEGLCGMEKRFLWRGSPVPYERVLSHVIMSSSTDFVCSLFCSKYRLCCTGMGILEGGPIASSLLMGVTTLVSTFMLAGTGVTGLRRDNDLVEEFDLTLSVGELRPLRHRRIGKSPGSDENELFLDLGFRGVLKKFSPLGISRESLRRELDLAGTFLLLLETFLSSELSLEW